MRLLDKIFEMSDVDFCSDIFWLYDSDSAIINEHIIIGEDFIDSLEGFFVIALAYW
jgi:hypothetical protein